MDEESIYLSVNKDNLGASIKKANQSFYPRVFINGQWIKNNIIHTRL